MSDGGAAAAPAAAADEAAAQQQAAAAAQVSISGRMDSLSKSVGSLLQQVNATVAARLAEWSTAFYRDQRDSTAAVAEKVDYVVDAFVTACSPDFSDDVASLRLTTQQAAVLDRTRREQPAAFDVLRRRADELMTVDPLKAKALVKAAVEEVLAAVAK
jgi:hypothetical protein